MDHAPTRRDRSTYLFVVATLLLWFAAPGLVRGFAFPVGPDAPVYLWWTRLVGVEGLSSVTRPGVPALALVLAGTLRAPVAAILAALEIVGGVLTGLTAAAVLRTERPDDRGAWALGGVLAGTFSVHIATGYLATLVFAVLFLAAAAALATRTRRGAVAATALLGAGAIAHPRFLAVGGAIFVLAAVLAWREDRGEAQRLLVTVGGATAILAIAGLALLVGPSPLLVDTSRDAFLRRAGLTDILGRTYLTRFVARWTRYAPWGIAPLVASSIRRPRTTVDRILVAWVVVACGGAVASAATGLLPIDRFVTFAFALPMLAAIGATRIARSHALPRIVAVVAPVLLVGTMLLGAGSAWLRQEPVLDDRALGALRVANAVAVAAPETALVVPVAPERSAFLLTLAGNAMRAAVPPDRIRDVVVVADPAGAPRSREAAAMVAVTPDDVRAVVALADGRAQRILLRPFADPSAPPAAWTSLTDEVAVDPPFVGPTSSRTRATVAPFDPWLPSLLALATIVLLAAIGRPWARRVVPDDPDAALALAPAVGLGGVILLAFVLERFGLPLAGTLGPLAVSAVGFASGRLADRLLARRRVAGGPGAGA